MILISTSEVIAEIIPELWYEIDPDLPLDDELPRDLRLRLGKLIFKTFRLVTTEEDFSAHWMLRLKADHALRQLMDMNWVNIEVIDVDGTFLLKIEDDE